ncbi:MAG: hypothetical protein KatS3mg035_1077 [Bacteroidia bacterium]|nr:MAG: hypothetical protein KatS3mg035_1077 [Bacteroidia bacterium]
MKFFKFPFLFSLYKQNQIIKNMDLATAISHIERVVNKKVSMIEYEDGSMLSFNVKFMGQTNKIYVKFNQKGEIVKMF